ncbi:zinc metallopeptidase [Marivirga atlantica]|jgi:Zn-dependent membrane protease YugP|uniref:Zinc metallopeptidase n=1 Tax=Marivirga atlantica TaxID=1548457 RepID=A0A937A831_9BACT|nr:zinc metallopeptidase [Marivirga atlantica]MBL0763920.1 zinc metallopeptidase [Marivirga atlantica]
MLIIIFIGFAIASFAVQSRLKSKFKKYSKVALNSQISGKEAAEKMLKDNGIYDVEVMSVQGQLTDHYNPSNKTVNLSRDVYEGRSAAAVAVAAHEVGHAVQHAKAYSWLEMRSALVPLQNVSARIINIVFIAMFAGAFLLPQLINFQLALMVIIGCYTIFTLFALITLPVEFDASKRGLAWMTTSGIATNQEHDMAKDALKWAAMTYVVAALASLVTLLYYVMLFMGGDD